jgi:ribonuclease P protein component
LKKDTPWLKSSITIKQTRDFGQSRADKLMIIISKPNDLERTRFAVIASRSVGMAVNRNRCKRIIRACINQNLSHYLPGFDVLYIARRPLLQAKHQEVVSNFDALNRAARLLKNE